MPHPTRPREETSVCAFENTLFVSHCIDHHSLIACFDQRPCLMRALPVCPFVLFLATIVGTRFKRFSVADEAIEDAPSGSAVLVLADGYPERQTPIPKRSLAEARRKNLKLYLEYPEAVPGIALGAQRGVQWERGIVALDDPAIGLAKLSIVSLQDCRFLPVSSRPSLLVLGRVAGFDSAVYGIPDNASPLLFRSNADTLIATTRLSSFVTARLAPTADWVTIWRSLLTSLDPAGSPHQLTVIPAVRPSYSLTDRLAPTAERAALNRCADWFKGSGLLISAERRPTIETLLRAGQDLTPGDPGPPGDGTSGILEGYASQIRPDGSQLQRHSNPGGLPGGVCSSPRAPRCALRR
jgi:hypothetical protein